jgi:anti-sigma factor RsiW
MMMGEHCLDEPTLFASLDGSLPEAERVPLEQHLEGCSACRTEYQRLRAFDRLVERERQREVIRARLPEGWHWPEEDLLDDYFCGDLNLTPELEHWLRSHIDGCPRCRAHLAFLEQGTAALEADLAAEEVDWVALLENWMDTAARSIRAAFACIVTTAGGVQGKWIQALDELRLLPRVAWVPEPVRLMGREGESQEVEGPIRQAELQGKTWAAAVSFSDEPEGGLVTVDLLDESGAGLAPTVRVLDAAGTVVAEQQAENRGAGRYVAEVGGLPVGAYLVTID